MDDEELKIGILLTPPKEIYYNSLYDSCQYTYNRYLCNFSFSFSNYFQPNNILAHENELKKVCIKLAFDDRRNIVYDDCTCFKTGICRSSLSCRRTERRKSVLAVNNNDAYDNSYNSNNIVLSSNECIYMNVKEYDTYWLCALGNSMSQKNKVLVTSNHGNENQVKYWYNIFDLDCDEDMELPASLYKRRSIDNSIVHHVVMENVHFNRASNCDDENNMSCKKGFLYKDEISYYKFLHRNRKLENNISEIDVVTAENVFGENHEMLDKGTGKDARCSSNIKRLDIGTGNSSNIAMVEYDDGNYCNESLINNTVKSEHIIKKYDILPINSNRPFVSVNEATSDYGKDLDFWKESRMSRNVFDTLNASKTRIIIEPFLDEYRDIVCEESYEASVKIVKLFMKMKSVLYANFNVLFFNSCPAIDMYTSREYIYHLFHIDYFNFKNNIPSLENSESKENVNNDGCDYLRCYSSMSSSSSSSSSSDVDDNDEYYYSDVDEDNNNNTINNNVQPQQGVGVEQVIVNQGVELENVVDMETQQEQERVLLLETQQRHLEEQQYLLQSSINISNNISSNNACEQIDEEMSSDYSTNTIPSIPSSKLLQGCEDESSDNCCYFHKNNELYGDDGNDDGRLPSTSKNIKISECEEIRESLKFINITRLFELELDNNVPYFLDHLDVNNEVESLMKSSLYDYYTHLQVGKNDSIWVGDILYRHNISYMVSPNIIDWTETPLQKINIEPGVYKISSNDIKLTTKIGKDDVRALKEYYDDCIVCESICNSIYEMENKQKDEKQSNVNLVRVWWPDNNTKIECTDEEELDYGTNKPFDRFVHMWAKSADDVKQMPHISRNWWDILDKDINNRARKFETNLDSFLWYYNNVKYYNVDRKKDEECKISSILSSIDVRRNRFMHATKLVIKNPNTFFLRKNLVTCEINEFGLKGSVMSIVDQDTHEVCGVLMNDVKGVTRLLKHNNRNVSSAFGVHFESKQYSEMSKEIRTLFDHMIRSHTMHSNYMDNAFPSNNRNFSLISSTDVLCFGCSNFINSRITNESKKDSYIDICAKIQPNVSRWLQVNSSVNNNSCPDESGSK